MDSLTHALIGIAVAGLSGHQPALSDPIYIAAVLGSQAPDFDLVAQVRGSMAYLRQHRAFSHSFPGVALWALAIAGGLELYFTQMNFLQNLLWAFIGGISHILIDYFNTHGVALLWPFKRDRKSTPLLNVFDPALLVLMLVPYTFTIPIKLLSLTTFGIIAGYIILRYQLRQQASAWLKTYFNSYAITKLWVMPSLSQLLCWDFVIETDSRVFNGRRGIFRPILTIEANLPKQINLSTFTKKAQQTELGQFFDLFTPYIFFKEQYLDTNLVKVTIYDLRYYTNQHFIHSATIIFDLQETSNVCFLHSMGRTLKVAD
ncbi:MAG: Protein of unknown function transrane [Firmicutes bacterium]|nr:Protein of unknown function transrane [Bacillota bacterium]